MYKILNIYIRFIVGKSLDSVHQARLRGYRHQDLEKTDHPGLHVQRGYGDRRERGFTGMKKV
jgi:hypothetical protein